jgi:hypothetical protein
MLAAGFATETLVTGVVPCGVKSLAPLAASLSLPLLFWLKLACLLSDPSGNFCCKVPEGKNGGEAELSEPVETFLGGGTSFCLLCASILLHPGESCAPLLELHITTGLDHDPCVPCTTHPSSGLEHEHTNKDEGIMPDADCRNT